MGSRQFRIEARFQMEGRGTVIVISGPTHLPFGKKLCAIVTLPDSSQLTVEAFREWPSRRDPQPVEREAYLLPNIDKSSLPEDSLVEIHLTE
jgi:hypothetical protein